jgi:hypothetical protein
MGIALVTLSSLLTPLQGFVARMMSANRRPAMHAPRPRLQPVTPIRAAMPRAVAGPEVPDRVATAASRRNSGVHLHRSLPLRVVRTLDSGIPPGSTGRMMISGRMADVCAELDRLAATEAAM